MSLISKTGLLAVYLCLLLNFLLHYSVLIEYIYYPLFFYESPPSITMHFSIAEHSFWGLKFVASPVMQLESACLLSVIPWKLHSLMKCYLPIMHTTDVFILRSTDCNFLWPRWWLSPSRLLTIAPTLTIAHEKRGGRKH